MSPRDKESLPRGAAPTGSVRSALKRPGAACSLALCAALGLASCNGDTPGTPLRAGASNAKPAEELDPGPEAPLPSTSPTKPSLLPASSRASGPASATVPSTFDTLLVDITAAAGIQFRHESGAAGHKYLPETMGSGAAFLDYDGDGNLDIFFVNSTRWETSDGGGPSPTCALYRGRGDGTFEDVSAATGTAVSLYGMGCAVGDPDGDGDDDIFVTAVGPNLLLLNEGGVFREAARERGLEGGRWTDPSTPEDSLHWDWSTAAAWADFDGDGDVDLLVIGYVQWTPAREIFTTLDGVTKGFTTPERYAGLPPRLYLNDGHARFEDRSREAGLLGLEGKGLGIALWDFDHSGLLDVVVANDTRPNFLLLNRGGGVFEERGLTSGIAYDEAGRARAGMGVDIQDFEGTGAPVVVIGNFGDEPMSYYTWEEGGTFISGAGRVGLAGPTNRPLAFGVLGADLDLDGRLDLLVANGHIEPEIARVAPGQTYEQPPQAFAGREGVFEEVSDRLGPDFRRPRVGRGLCVGDIDGDGDLDVLFTANGGPPALLRNDSTLPRRSLRVLLEGEGRNTRALGAEVVLQIGGRWLRQVVRSGSSYLSQSERALTFGLGFGEAPGRLEVRWPDGATTTIESPPTAGLLKVRKS